MSANEITKVDINGENQFKIGNNDKRQISLEIRKYFRTNYYYYFF